jgi:type I restriction enzyme, S subunit
MKATTNGRFKIIKSPKPTMEDKMQMQRGTIGDYFTLQRGTTYKSGLLGQPGPVLLGLATIRRNGGFRTDSLRTYGGDSPDKLLVQPGEIYVSLKDVTQSADLLGAVARLPYGSLAGRLTQDTVKLEPKSDDVPLDYLYWLLRTPQYRAYCRAHSTGTTNLGLSREDFLAFPAPEPTSKQLLLAEMLGTLDGKIELNQQINQTLETISRKLFKHWFVDFEFPNEEGKPYKSSGGEMVDSELGEIPKGWKEDLAIKLFELKYGWHLPEWDRKEGNVPVFGSGGLSGFHNNYFVTAPGIIIGRAGKIGPEAVYYSHINFCPLETTFYVSVNNKKCVRYLYFFIKTLSMINTGSSVPNLSRSNIHNIKILIPDEKIIENYDRIVEPFFELICKNYEQSENLSQIRDELLPKLMSGKIRVPVPKENIEVQ